MGGLPFALGVAIIRNAGIGADARPVSTNSRVVASTRSAARSETRVSIQAPRITDARTGGRARRDDQPPSPQSGMSLTKLAWVTLLPGATLRVSQTLPPMVDPLPMVMRPRIVAPAYITTSSSINGWRGRPFLSSPFSPGGKRLAPSHLVEPHAVADDGGLADHHAGAMVDEEAAADGGARMDVDAGVGMGDLGHHARQHGHAQPVQHVGQAMVDHRGHAGIAQQHLVGAVRGRRPDRRRSRPGQRASRTWQLGAELAHDADGALLRVGQQRRIIAPGVLQLQTWCSSASSAAPMVADEVFHFRADRWAPGAWEERAAQILDLAQAFPATETRAGRRPSRRRPRGPRQARRASRRRTRCRPGSSARAWCGWAAHGCAREMPAAPAWE